MSKPILFENDQGWKVINCTYYYPAGNPAREGCTSPDFAILNTPGGGIGDGPLDKGRIGTLNKLAYPAQSVWAVYDLIEFRLTPVVDPKYYDEMITVEVFGWKEDGSKTETMRFHIKGSETGYKVSTPYGTWNNILQWQVRVWWSAGSRETREDFPYIIDDMVIDEHAWNPDEGGSPWSCNTPTQVPGPEPPAQTLKFDDVPQGPIPTPYKSFTFNDAWTVVGLESAVSKPNALYAQIASSASPNPQIVAQNFLFDADSFRITIDNTATGSQNPGDLELTIQGYGPCFDIEQFSGSVGGNFRQIIPTSYSFDVDLKTFGYRKQRGMSISVWDTPGQQRVPFWIDDVVVKNWGDSLGGLPGCERCGKFYSWFCEYPKQYRDPAQ
ncbi:hypothetical protein Q9L58_009750 [Maublancomyces gigas]|uniref:Uncharacterized protein n=1 Tax=Discina gigas TaxID=1032678 RepID=A0ABR3G5Z2_9PEZI